MNNFRLDFVKLLEPYSSSFFAIREKQELHQIPISKLGSGIETICALLFLDTIFDSGIYSIVYCIDEPELHLHPQAQKQLLSLLKKMSKNKQIFISTHSPCFLDPSLINNVYRFENKEGEINYYLCPDDTMDSKQTDFLNQEIKDIFFAKKVLCVEGKTDLNGFSKYFKGLGDWTIIKMNSKEEAKKFYKVLKAFSLQFKIILDLDAIRGKQISRKDGSESETNTFKNFLENIQTKIVKLGKASIDELKDNVLSEEEAKQKNEILSDLAKENIFVLRYGEIEDYLDENGKVLTENQYEKDNELRGIFK